MIFLDKLNKKKFMKLSNNILENHFKQLEETGRAAFLPNKFL